MLGRRFYWKVAGLLAFENAIDVSRRASGLVDEVRPIRNQAAVGDEQAIAVHCGQSVSGSQRDDQIAMKRRQRTFRHDQAAIAEAREGSDGALDLVDVTHVDRTYLHPQGR